MPETHPDITVYYRNNTDGRRFSRMLGLEFSAVGYSVNYDTVERRVPTASGEAVFSEGAAQVAVICDAAPEFRSGDCFPLSAGGILVFCVPGDCPRSAEFGGRVFRRPFAMTDLLAYIAKITAPPAGEAVFSKPEPAHELKISSGVCEAVYRGEHIPLTTREYELLSYLYGKRGEAASRRELLNAVWNYSFIGETNVVDVYIRYLRRKLDERFGERLVVTVRGGGYRLSPGCFPLSD